MSPQYEEKTFESYFNSELDRRASIYFPFGQVQEGGIGADASAFSKNRKLWRLLGYPSIFRLPLEGVSLREMAEEMELALTIEVKNIPDMKANLLFQYKRPEQITRKNGTEWPHWSKPYFRYNIYKEQQHLLAHLANKFGDRALILYAAPAIIKLKDLIAVKRKRQVIEHTNFRPAVDLHNHHRNTYVQAGMHSIACSEPQKLEPFDLLTRLDRYERVQRDDNSSFLIKFATEVRESTLRDVTFGRIFEEELSGLMDARLDEFPLFFAVLTMKTFRELTAAQWAILINDD